MRLQFGRDGDNRSEYTMKEELFQLWLVSAYRQKLPDGFREVSGVPGSRPLSQLTLIISGVVQTTPVVWSGWGTRYTSCGLQAAVGEVAAGDFRNGGLSRSLEVTDNYCLKTTSR